MKYLIKILDEMKATNYKCIIDYETVEKKRAELDLPKYGLLWRDSIKWDMSKDNALEISCKTEISNILSRFSNYDVDVRLKKEKELLEFMRNYLNN